MATNSTGSTLPWNFDNLTLRSLPVDCIEGAIGSRIVPNACFSRVHPTPVTNPRLIAYSLDALQLLFGTSYQLKDEDIKNDLTIKQLSGCELIKGSEPAAHCYCGHQFGNFAGQLGDGAAIYLGDCYTNLNQRWEIQLKGAGRTPYSRTADGRKVLRSSIREFLCSEAMHFLGIPTTRAGSLITSTSRVERDNFYDGNVKLERCTIVSRIAPTFIRFGSFEICLSSNATSTGRGGPSEGNEIILKQLLFYVVKNFYPSIWTKYVTDNDCDDGKKEVEMEEDKLSLMTVDFVKEVAQRTARLVAHWQTVGFCHGVLNTDNMSIIGLTIDYGPFGFMDRFDPDFICNASDNAGRYTYEAQPEICCWNCERLWEALARELNNGLPVEELRECYWLEYKTHYRMLMRQKLGILLNSSIVESAAKDDKEKEEDDGLFEKLFEIMLNTGADFTLTFTALIDIARQQEFQDLLLTGKTSSIDKDSPLNKIVGKFVSEVCCSLEELWQGLKPTYSEMERLMILNMFGNNVARIRAVGGHMLLKDLDKIEKRDQLKDMTEEQKRQKDVDQWLPWFQSFINRLHRDCESVASWTSERVKCMEESNPRIVLRNYLAELAIRRAEDDEDFAGVGELLEELKKPYTLSSQKVADVVTTCRPPVWANDLRVT